MRPCHATGWALSLCLVFSLSHGAEARLLGAFPATRPSGPTEICQARADDVTVEALALAGHAARAAGMSASNARARANSTRTAALERR